MTLIMINIVHCFYYYYYYYYLLMMISKRDDDELRPLAIDQMKKEFDDGDDNGLTDYYYPVSSETYKSADIHVLYHSLHV